MEESKSKSTPVELSKSIYSLIKGSESISFSHALKNENSENVQNKFNSEGGRDKDETSSYLFEKDSCVGMKSKSRKNIEVDDNNTTFQKSQPIPKSYSIHDSEVDRVVSTQIDYDNNKNNEESPTSSNSSVTTECFYDLESSSSTTDNDTLSSDISNARRADTYSLGKDRLPMADLYNQYHIVSHHGFDTSTSSIDTCDTRCSTPSFPSHASMLTSASDTNMSPDSEVDVNLEAANGRSRTVYGSYSIKSRYREGLDSNADMAFENVKLTSLQPFENDPVETGVESNLKASNSGDQKSKLTLRSHSPIPPPLPASQPPETPPSSTMVYEYEINGDNFTGTTHVNGNHVVQNLSSEMYKTMKKVITPGKVHDLKKIFADFFHDTNVENVFLPQQIENQTETIENIDSVSNVISVHPLPVDDAGVERQKINREESMKENIHKEEEKEGKERTMSKGENLLPFDYEHVYARKLIEKEESHIPTQEPKLNQKQIQSLENKQQEEKLLVGPVKQLLPETAGKKYPDYFTDVESTTSVSKSGVTHSTSDLPVTNSDTQEDYVSYVNRTRIKTRKLPLVMMTPTVNKVGGEGAVVRKVLGEIIPASAAPLLLPPGKTEFTETEKICTTNENEAELLLQGAELVVRESGPEYQVGEERDEKKKKKDVGQEERDNKNEKWKEEVESRMIVEESAVVEKKESGEMEIKKKKEWEEKIEVKDMGNRNEVGKEEEKKNQEKDQRGGGRGEGAEEQVEKYVKQLEEEIESNVTKDIESFVDLTTNQNINYISDSNKKELLFEINETPSDKLSSSHGASMIISLDETPGPFDESLMTGYKLMPEDMKAAELTPLLQTTCVQTFPPSLAGYSETLTTTSTIGLETATTTVSNEVYQVSDTPPRCVVDSSVTPVEDNNNYSTHIVTTDADAEEEGNINSPHAAAAPTGQTSVEEKILTPVSQVVNEASTTLSPSEHLQPFPTINVNKGLLSHDELYSSEKLPFEVAANDDENSNRIQTQQQNTKEKISEDDLKVSNNDNNNDGKENEENKRIKTKENDECKEFIDERRKKSSAIRKSNSAVAPARKGFLIPRTHSMQKLRRSLTDDPVTAPDECDTGTIFPFRELRRMFEEGRPLKTVDYEKDLPLSPIRTQIHPTNINAADQSNAEQPILYPRTRHKESYVTRKTPSLTAKSRDVYLSKQSTAKINKSEATCKTATTTTTRMTSTAAPVTANINQLSSNAFTTRLLSSEEPDGWSAGTKVNNTFQNANIDSSFLKNDVSFGGAAAFSTPPHSVEAPLKLETTRKSDSDTISERNGYDTGSKDLKVVKQAEIFTPPEGKVQASQITRLKSSTIEDNQLDPKYEKSESIKLNNGIQSNMDFRNGHGYAPVEKVSSFRIHTHQTDNKADMEEATLSSTTSAVETLLSSSDDRRTPITKSREDKHVYSISITGESNPNKDTSKSKTDTDCNQYISQIGVNSDPSQPGPAQNIILFGQNDSPKVTDNIIMGSNLTPVNMYLDSNFGAMVPGTATLTQASSVLAAENSTVISETHLTPMRNVVEPTDVNRGPLTSQVNILSTNEITEAAPRQLTPAQFVNEVDVNRNIAINEAINSKAYNVGVDSTLQSTLSNNNTGTTIDNVSISPPGIQYYNDSQSCTDAWQTTLNSTTLFTTVVPVSTGLTSYDQSGLSSTWNAGIPMVLHTQQQQQEVMQQGLISSPTPSSLYVGSKERTEKSGNETSINIQGNVFRRVFEFEKTPEDPNLEKQKSHNLRSGKTVDLSAGNEDAETTYERVKRGLRPIPAKNDNYLKLSSTLPNPDSSLEDSSHIHDMSSLRGSQTPSYYSVNDSITSFPEDNEDQNVVNVVNSDHQYAVVRLTPSDTDYNKVKHTIYCEIGGSGIKNETSASYDLTRQISDLSNVSFSIPSTAASDTEDELSDINDATLDKKTVKKTNRAIHKNIVMAETDLMETNTYKTEENIFLNSAQHPKSADPKMHHTSATATDSGTGTEIISSEGEAESQETESQVTTETWCEYENIPYEKYEQISKSSDNISRSTADACFVSRPSSLSVSSSSQTTTTTTTSATATHYQMNTQPSELRNSTQSTNFDISSSQNKNDQIYEVHTEPETVSLEGEEDLRIVRGRLLIKNTIDSPKDGDDFDDNINVFAEEFHLDKENPLYQSDPDLFKDSEDDEELFLGEWSEDITFDQVDNLAKSHKVNKEVMKSEVRGKQKLSNMLLSRLSKLDSKDIKQSINVEHHHEEIYGDIDFIQADGTKTSSDYTENFDSIAENVELLMKSGKAVIVIKVIAERIVPIDYEFNVWRKSSAIVTRQIELDLQANEQRKRLYNYVMENADGQQSIEPQRYGSYLERTQGAKETVLNSRETFRLFNQLLNVAENSGEGGDQNESYSEKTERLALQRPSISDFMY